MTKNVLGGDIPVRGAGDDIEPNDANETALWGDGSDGSYTSGDNLDSGVVYNFTDLTLNSGDTLTRASGDEELPIIIRVQGDVTIDGTIDLRGDGKNGGGGASGIMAGRGSGPSMHFDWIDINDFDDEVDNENVGVRNLPSNYIYRPMGGFGGYGADNTGNSGFTSPGDGGNSPPNYIQNAPVFKLIQDPQLLLPGAGGGGGGAGDDSDSSSEGEGGAGGGGGASMTSNGAGGNDGGDGFDSAASTGSGGNGGSGGGSILILCGGDLTINGTVDVRGEDGTDGQDAEAAGGGGGGGAGGQALLMYQGSLTDNGTKLAAGGSGGSGGSGSQGNGGSGGSGGSGRIQVVTT